MSTSERTISQVRAILSKLDRSIDEARDRRLYAVEPGAIPGATPAPMDDAPPPPPIPAPTPAQNGNGAPGRSPFGRATPLNRPPAPQLRWGS
jgi:hypothetical protein